MLYQGRNVLAPIAQGRKNDGNDVDPIVEIQPEQALLDETMQITIGSGDEPYIDASRGPGAHGPDFTLLKHSKQFGLHGERHVTQLIQKQRSPMGQLENPFSVSLSSREGASYVTKKFAFQERFCQGGTVLGEERLCRSQASPMNLSRDDLLARTTFPNDENGKIARGGFADELIDSGHAGRLDASHGTVRLGIERGGQY